MSRVVLSRGEVVAGMCGAVDVRSDHVDVTVPGVNGAGRVVPVELKIGTLVRLAGSGNVPRWVCAVGGGGGGLSCIGHVILLTTNTCYDICVCVGLQVRIHMCATV